MSTCALGTAEEVQSCQVNYILSSKTRGLFFANSTAWHRHKKCKINSNRLIFVVIYISKNGEKNNK